MQVDHQATNHIESESDTSRTTLVLANSNWVGGSQPAPEARLLSLICVEPTVRELRGRTITSRELPQVPAVDWNNLEEERNQAQLHWILHGSGAKVLSNSPGGRLWLLQTNLGRAFLAVPEQLRTFDYVREVHWHALTVTGVLSNRGLLDDPHWAILHLKHQTSQDIGRFYLTHILNCPRLAELRLTQSGLEALNNCFVGRIYLTLWNRRLLNFGTDFWGFIHPPHHLLKDHQLDYSFVCCWCNGLTFPHPALGTNTCICWHPNSVEPSARANPRINLREKWHTCWDGKHIIPGFSQNCFPAHPLEEEFDSVEVSPFDPEEIKEVPHLNQQVNLKEVHSRVVRFGDHKPLF